MLAQSAYVCRRGIFKLHQKPTDTVSGGPTFFIARSNSCRSWPSSSQLQMPSLSSLRPNELKECTESSGAKERESDRQRRSPNILVLSVATHTLSLCAATAMERKTPEAYPAVLDATSSRQRAKSNTMSKGYSIEKIII